MSNAARWRLLAVVAVLAASAALVASRPARLGLDLQGGTQIVLEAQDTERQKVDGDTASRVLEVLRRRVDALGVSEPALQRSGDRRIIVELPGVADPKEAVAAIGRTAQLTIHAVLGLAEAEPVPAGEGSTTTTSAPPPDAAERVLTADDGSRLRVGPTVLTGEAVSTARASFAPEAGSSWEVEIDFRGDGGRAWQELTGKAACAGAGDPTRRVAIVLDEEVISSPPVAPEVACSEGIGGGKTVISGQFSEREAKNLALLIRAGALPVPVEIVEQRTIGPTLGDAAVKASTQAAVIGASLTILYMVGYYRLLGALAALALLAYGLISYAVLLALNATLTLPGIAGFVLAIGMAVDANVLIFERIKEEHGAGRSLRLASNTGFRRAWSAIADSNATTLIAAVLLFFYATGAVRGFGVTLTVGVLASMFTALVVTRALVEMVLRSRYVVARPRLLGMHVGASFINLLARRGTDIIGRSRLWLVLSGVAVALAIAGIVGSGLTYGLEFSGGRLVEYDTARPADVDRLRAALFSAAVPQALVQSSGEGNVTVRTPELSDAQEARVTKAVEAVGGASNVVRDEFVGPTIGDELRRKAMIALGLALAAQLVYLAVRFRWTYGAAAVVAMFHDVVILLGLFAWLGKTLDGVFLAALLTVIGYSINDSVVVFDRIREQRRARGREPLATVANDACLQTLPRTINTGLGALFILVALYLLGGDTLTDFALALLVGIVAGTYSSICTAAPLAVAIEARLAPKSTFTERKVFRPLATAGSDRVSKPERGEDAQKQKEPQAAEVLVASNETRKLPSRPVRRSQPKPRKQAHKPGKKKRGRR